MSSVPAFRRSLARFGAGLRPQLVVQAGEDAATLLLVRRAGSRVRVLKQRSADLRADALLSPLEMAERLRVLLAELPAAPATVVLPPGRTHSQLMPLRDQDSRAVADLARAVGGRQFEAVPSIFDARPLPPSPRRPRAQWVSIAREADVEIQLLRCGIAPERVAAVIGSDAALAAAFTSLPKRPPLAVLIELGPVSGLLVVVESDRLVFTADLDWGSGELVTALAADLGCSGAEAERIIARDGGEVIGPATPRLSAGLQRLRQTVETLLQDYARESGQDPAELLAAPRWLSGPGFDRGHPRELVAHALGGPEGRGLRTWPELIADDGATLRLSAGVIAYGAAMVATGVVEPPPNLAPAGARDARRAELWIGGLHAAGLVLALTGLTAAGLALHRQREALAEREAEERVLREARDVVPLIEVARRERDAAYVAAAPVLYLQKRTRDFVTGARLLRERRGAGDFWFALVTDVETYRAGSLPQGTPAAAPESQLLPGLLARPSGLVVELSFRPGGGDALAQVGELISELRGAEDFSRVDILPARARQPTLSDRSVFAPEGSDFALQLDAPPFDGVLPASVLPPASGGRGLFQSNP